MRSAPPVVPPVVQVPLAEPAGWRRRIASAVYESVLVIAIVVLASLAFPGAATGRLPQWERHLLAGYVIVVLGGYFIWFWTHGQTLAMRAWRLALVDRSGARLGWARAAGRYVTGLTLLAPGILAAFWWREHRDSTVALVLLAIAAATLLWPLWDRERRALYDLVAGTRLVRLL